MPRLQLEPAGAPELVRTNQKDRFYTDYIASDISNISHHLLPLRYLFRWEREFQLLAEIWYYGLTTVCGNQTLGEEYCDIVQVGPRQSHNFLPPTFLRRTLAVLLQALGPYLLERALQYASQRLESRDLPLHLGHRQHKQLEIGLDLAAELVSSARLLHLALFYVRGVFYQVGKRVTRIRYLAVRVPTDNRLSQPYRVLGWLVLCQVVVKLFIWVRRFSQLLKSGWEIGDEVGEREERSSPSTMPAGSSSQGEESVQLKCPLCWEPCQHVTATPCGHLFCWTCVAEWMRDQRECPVCRSEVEPRTLIALQHFAV